LDIGTEIKGCPKLATGITPQFFLKKKNQVPFFFLKFNLVKAKN